jgi:ABC-2 type transport system ATP-binding protein
VEKLAESNARRVTVYGRADLTGLDGIRELKTGGAATAFLYSGDMNALLRRLSEGEITDLTVTEPDLEEIFLHFYEKGGERA